MDASQDFDVMQLFNAENDLLGVVSEVSLPEPVYKKYRLMIPLLPMK
ncbi:hypothetical protein [Zymomonas mobilis]|nr:hypothetical protein [Zymomonas mobilis]